MVERTLEQFGQIDILVNNAGWTNNDLFLRKPIEDFEREIAINLWGPRPYRWNRNRAIHIFALAIDQDERGFVDGSG